MLLLITAWLILPILAEVFTHLTTRPLLIISTEVQGFWDTVGGVQLHSIPVPPEIMNRSVGEVMANPPKFPRLDMNPYGQEYHGYQSIYHRVQDYPFWGDWLLEGELDATKM
jgi:hypothetical protein